MQPNRQGSNIMPAWRSAIEVSYASSRIVDDIDTLLVGTGDLHLDRGHRPVAGVQPMGQPIRRAGDAGHAFSRYPAEQAGGFRRNRFPRNAGRPRDENGRTARPDGRRGSSGGVHLA